MGQKAPARSRRRSPHAPPHAAGRRRAHRRPVRAELRGRRRGQCPRRRPGRRNLPVRHSQCAAVPGARHMSMEQIYEYGSRAGVWRLLRLFARLRHPAHRVRRRAGDAAQSGGRRAFLEAGHEIASHGWRWINYQNVPEAEERADLARAIEVHRQLTGERPLGWYTGWTSPNTRRLVRRGRRLPLRRRRLFGRPAPSGRRRRQEPPDRPLFAGNQRHALRQRQHADRRPVRLPARHVRHALRGGRGVRRR